MNLDQTTLIHQALIAEVKRRIIEESAARIKKCLNLLTPAEIWHRPNAHLVSVGNLVLHLCGNVSQWILSGLGSMPDTRQRQLEFDLPGPLPTHELVAGLDLLMHQLDGTLNQLTPDQLLQIRSVQGIFTESGLSILVHVTEHFAYHTGQITYYTKLIKNTDLAYYGDLDLTQHSSTI